VPVGRQPEQFREEIHILFLRRGSRDQGPELPEFGFPRVLAIESGGVLELGDDRVKSAVGVMGRAEVSETNVRLTAKELLQGGSQARFADAGLSREKQHSPVTRFRLLPATLQQLEFLRASDERRQRGIRAERFETARDRAGAEHLPGTDRLGESLDLGEPKIAIIKKAADELARARCDDHRAWFGERLQPGRKIRRFAHYTVLARLTRPDEIADDNQTRCDADAHLEFGAGHHVESADRLDERQPGA
jgi:hypothetical protein